MIASILTVGIVHAPAPSEVEAPAATRRDPTRDAPAPETTAVPWSVLKDRRLRVTTTAGTTTEGVFLGVDDGAAILEADDGTLLGVAVDDVASVRTIKQAPPAAAAIPVPPEGMMTLAFREQDARRRTERMARGTRGAAIAGGVLASLSAFSSVVAEGFNIKRWSLAKRTCGESYYGYGERCGWSDGVDSDDGGSYSYDGYENMWGIVTASTIAVPFHVLAGPTMLVPSTLLRNRIGYTEGRGRHVAAWALWGAGLGSLIANQAVSWTQIMNAEEICDPSTANRADCSYVTPTRGAPPPLYLLSAGLAVSSAILGIIDANAVTRQAERTAAARATNVRSARTVSLFPFRLQRGGGFGVVGRF